MNTAMWINLFLSILLLTGTSNSRNDFLLEDGAIQKIITFHSLYLNLVLILNIIQSVQILRGRFDSLKIIGCANILELIYLSGIFAFLVAHGATEFFVPEYIPIYIFGFAYFFLNAIVYRQGLKKKNGS